MSSEEQQMDWWITTDFFRNNGQKVMGPFASRDLALEVRAYREAVERRDDYFVDSEPRPNPVKPSPESDET